MGLSPFLLGARLAEGDRSSKLAPKDPVKVVTDRLLDGYDEMSDWLKRSFKSIRYLHGHQWDEMSAYASKNRLSVTANIIKRDIESMRARILDADPVMDTHGRGAEDFQLGDLWSDLIRWSEDWTGQWHDSCREVRERIVDRFFSVGQGYEKVGWNDSEEAGLGMVVSEDVDHGHLVWDPDAKSAQKRDARWVTQFEPARIIDLDEEFPKFAGQFVQDYPDLLMSGGNQANLSDYRISMGQQRPDDASRTDQRKCFRIEQWEKRISWDHRYFLDGQPAVMRQDGEEVPLARGAFLKMAAREQEQYREVKVRRPELWVTLVCGGVKVKEEMSVFDESNGGHGEFPFGFYSNVWDPNQSHAHGEIEYLMGLQDVYNQALSRYLESLFISVQQALFYYEGSMASGEEAKLDLIGKRPMQRIKLYPGQQLPQWAGANPIAAQLFQQAIPFIGELHSRVSSIQDVNRAAPQYNLSGKAVRALQSEADLPQVIARLHIESGMRQATMLRIAVIQQMMRGSRLVRITPKAEKAGYSLFLGQDKDGVKGQFGLSEETAKQQLSEGEFDLPTGYMKDRQGNRGKVLEINDTSIRKFDLRLRLDSGRQANKEERLQLAEKYLQFLAPALGPEALKQLALWTARLQEVPDVAGLEEGLDKGSQADDALQQLEQIQKETGMGLEELAQAAMAYKALAEQAGKEEPPLVAPPAIAPAPPGGASVIPPQPSAPPAPTGAGAPLAGAIGA